MMLPETQQTKDRNADKIGHHTTPVWTQYTDHSNETLNP